MANEVWHLGHEANAVAWIGTPNYITTEGYFRSPQSRCAAKCDGLNSFRIILPGVCGGGATGWWFTGVVYLARNCCYLYFYNGGALAATILPINDGWDFAATVYDAAGVASASVKIPELVIGGVHLITLHTYTAPSGVATLDVSVENIHSVTITGGAAGHIGLTHVHFKGFTNQYGVDYAHWSELALANFDLRGKEVLTLPPTANGIYTETTGGYADIDEYTPDAAGVVWGADGQRYSFKTAALALANRRIVALGYAGKASASDGRHLSTFVRVDGVDYTLGALVSGGVPQLGQTIPMLNPATGAAWPVAALPDLEWGLRLDLDS